MEDIFQAVPPSPLASLSGKVLALILTLHFICIHVAVGHTKLSPKSTGMKFLLDFSLIWKNYEFSMAMISKCFID